MMIDDALHNNNQIDAVSDYECTENRSVATDTDKKFSLQTPTYQVKREHQTYNRATNNQSPIGSNGRAGYQPFAGTSQGNSSKNNKNNKFESAAARYKAQADDMNPHGQNFIIKRGKNAKNLQNKSSEHFLLAESKD